MKKRLISILLTVLMVMSLFSGLSVSAYADDVIDSSYYTEYKLVQGDYVLRICQKLGINYYTCKEAIMALNNITSENGFRYLSVGTVVKIPVSDAHAVAIMTGKAVSNSGSSSSSSGTADVSGKDSVAYYLVPYTMQRGETVLGVCNSLGINFTNNEEKIQAINGIKNWKSVKAGQTILLPVSKTPAVGTTCYAVLAHKVASGETAYTICQNNGINYGSNTKLLEALNNSKNLANLKAGKTFYMAVPTTIKAQTSTTTPSTGTTTDKNNTTDNNNTTNTTVKTFDINANINTNYGTMKFYVNNKAVEKAAEGDKVTVDVTTNDGRAVDSLVVKYEDGRADVHLESNTFIMPGCDVRVDASINTGYNITINSNYSFKTAAQVGGISVSSASDGSSVKIVSTDPSYAIKEVEAYYSTLWGVKKTVLTVNEQNCFTMPKKDVTVDVTLAPVETYSFFRNDVENGSFDIQVDGFSVSKAAKGAQVTILWQPVNGYEISSINVYKCDKAGKYTSTDKLSVYNNSFTMPNSPVYVEVEFQSCENAIEIEAIEGGVLYATLGAADAAHVSEADTGATVAIYGKAKLEGYNNDIIELDVIRKADGHHVTATDKGGYYEFKMPAGGVKITGKLESVEDYSVTVEFNATGSENRVTVKANGYENWNILDNSTAVTNNYAVGTKLNFSTLARDTHAFNKFEVYVGSSTLVDAELTEEINSTGSINMPASDLTIKAIFKADQIALAPATVIGSGTVSYQVNGVSALSAKVGDTVTIVAVSNDPNLAVKAENITVTVNNDRKTELTLTKSDKGYDFQMPPEGVSVTVKFAGVARVLTLKTVDETDVNAKVLQGTNLWGMYINTQSPADKIYENSNSTVGTPVAIKSGDAAIIFFEKELTDKYNIDRVEMTSTNNGAVHENGLEYNQGSYKFFMANEDLTITVYVKDKASKTHSLLDLSYPSDKMTVGCTVGENNNVVTTAKEGETVFVKAQVKNLDQYKLTEQGITITKKSSDNVGKGTFTYGGKDPATLAENNYYAITDGGKVIGWKYIMPAGGVNVSVSCKAVEYDINLTVKDTNGFTTAVDGRALVSAGYVVINTTESDVSTARQVAGGKAENVAYGAAVKVTLSETGASLYKIKSVTVPGVEVKNDGFWMPAKDVELTIILEEKTPVTRTVELASKAENGTVKFFSDKAMKKEITGNKVDVGATVYAKVEAATDYEIKEVKASDNNKKEVALTNKDGAYSFTVGKDILKITVEAKIESNTVTPPSSEEKVSLSSKVVGSGTVKFYSDIDATNEITEAEAGNLVYVKSFHNGSVKVFPKVTDGNGSEIQYSAANHADGTVCKFTVPEGDFKVDTFIG